MPTNANPAVQHTRPKPAEQRLGWGMGSGNGIRLGGSPPVGPAVNLKQGYPVLHLFPESGLVVLCRVPIGLEVLLGGEG